MPHLLLLFGLVGVAEVALVGAMSERYPAIALGAIALTMAVSLLSLSALGWNTAFDVVVIVLWGLVTGGVGPGVQAALMRRAGTRLRRTAGTLMPVAMNFGIAAGAALGSLVVDSHGPASLPVASAVPAMVAVIGFVLARGIIQSKPPFPSEIELSPPANVAQTGVE